MIPGHLEWVIIAGIVILLFGAKKIPDLAKGLGLGIREFKKAKNDAENEIEDATQSGTESEKRD